MTQKTTIKVSEIAAAISVTETDNRDIRFLKEMLKEIYKVCLGASESLSGVASTFWGNNADRKTDLWIYNGYYTPFYDQGMPKEIKLDLLFDDGTRAYQLTGYRLTVREGRYTNSQDYIYTPDQLKNRKDLIRSVSKNVRSFTGVDFDSSEMGILNEINDFVPKVFDELVSIDSRLFSQGVVTANLLPSLVTKIEYSGRKLKDIKPFVIQALSSGESQVEVHVRASHKHDLVFFRGSDLPLIQALQVFENQSDMFQPNSSKYFRASFNLSSVEVDSDGVSAVLIIEKK